jgi:hypothetical protein
MRANNAYSNVLNADKMRVSGDSATLGMGLVDLVRFELTTSSMPWKRAPNCATGPRPGRLLLYHSGAIRRYTLPVRRARFKHSNIPQIASIS